MKRKIVLFMVFLGIGGVAVAQKGGLKIRSEREPIELSPRQLLVRANRYLATINNIRVQIENFLAQARRERDIIKINCLREKLARVNALLQTYKARLRNLKRAIREEDRDQAYHEYSILSVLVERAKIIAKEAQGCVGKDLEVYERTRVIIETDLAIPKEDPTKEPPPRVIVERPPSASGYE
jgi:hypothetical protein